VSLCEVYAFGSTYARESQFADSEWLARVARMNGHRPSIGQRSPELGEQTQGPDSAVNGDRQ
jgi:hypothetical protein